MRSAKLAIFIVVALLWVMLDQCVKAYIIGTVPSTQGATGQNFGLFSLTMVHNTGGAWSIFSGNTGALAIFSITMCACVFVFVLLCHRKLYTCQLIALALVVGGGIGNAIDRFTLGYVVDFINLNFISFPVFNIADIGVTVGVFFLLAFWIVREFTQKPTSNASSSAK